MNKKKLKIIYIAHDDTAKTLAEYLNMTESTFSQKINERNGCGFTQPEIAAIKSRYNLSAVQVDEIFFEK